MRYEFFLLVILCFALRLQPHVVNSLIYIGCDFENAVDPLCSFYMDSSSDFEWKLDSADPHTSVTRPTTDHTYSNKSGHYVYIESAFQTQDGLGGNTSRFMSPTVLVPQRGTNDSHLCLEFYYHMYGPPSQNLHVFLREHGHNVPQYSHWNKSGNLGDVWHKEALTIPADNGFQIIFEGTKGTDFHGDISLDDILISEGHCAHDTTMNPTIPTVVSATPLNQFECDLDNSNCGFTNEPRNTFHWEWRGNSPRPPMGPLGDHTSGSAAGFYLFVPEDTANQRQEQRSRVLSPLFSKNTVHKCLRFYYYMKGNNVGSLNVYILQDNMTLPLVPNWGVNVSQGNLWQYSFIDIKPQPSNYKVVFEAIRGQDFDGSIAIDDIVLTNDLCPNLNASVDFESGLDNFIQDTTDDRNWNLNSYTPSWYTGPDVDHTYNNRSGHFVYLETSGRATQGHVARLLSPRILNTLESPRCLLFWYHMWGDDIEAFNVYITNGTAVTDKHTPLWTRSGNRGNKWRAAEVHLNSSVDFQVVFEAEQGPGYRGDIALDDIVIFADVCSGEHHDKNYPSITCDFEEAERCYYTQDTLDDLDWGWTNGDKVPLIDDHTTRNELGFYLLLSYGNPWSRWYGGVQHSIARMQSPYASPQKLRSCLEFWYYMYGKDTESLKVYVQKENEDLPTSPIWMKSGDQGDNWHRGTVDINVINARFRVVFEGTTGNTYRDDIALDDVTFHNSSSCPVFTTETPPPITLPPTRVNASCNFEDDYICNYTQIVRDEMDWSRRKNNRFVQNRWYGFRLSGPSRDHTLKTTQGYYMNFDCGYWWQMYDSRAQLATPYLATHSEPMCLHFYYFMFGTGVDFLNVYINPFGYTLTGDSQLAVYGNQGNKWHHGTLNLPPSSGPYRIIFEARNGYAYSCDIAIDDVTFTNGVCPTVLPSPAPLSAGNCNFEPSQDHLCGYDQDESNTFDAWGHAYKADDFDWTLNRGNTSSGNTGPTTDHTTRNGNGHYFYIESSLPRRPHQTARLISPVIEGSTEHICVQFYYHMKGRGIGNLRLIWKAENVEEKEVMKMAGEQGDDWKAKAVELQPYDKQFQLVFEGSIGRGIPDGDIAIDDISILRQPCKGHTKESQCTFDVAGDWCGYTQSPEIEYIWEWYNIEHTVGDPPINSTEDRSYVYFATSAQINSPQQEQIAQLTSRTIDGRSSQHCVELDFAFPQNSSSKITIAVIRSDGERSNVLTLFGSEYQSGWHHASKTIDKDQVGERFQVVFIGILSDSNGAIGLDNPTLSLGSCDEAQHVSASKTTSAHTASVGIMFGILSAFLIIAVVIFAATYLYRKHKDLLPAFAVKYKVHHENGATVEKKPRCMTIDNPLYASEPAVIQSTVTDDTATIIVDTT